MISTLRLMPILAVTSLTACAMEPVKVAVPVPDEPSTPGEMFFLGTWNCGVTEMTFTADKYTPSKGDKPIPVTTYTVRGATTDLTLKDGSKISVQKGANGQMSWYSHQSGDSFECRRV